MTLAEADPERRADGRGGAAVRTHRDRRVIHPGAAAAACCQETQLPCTPHIRRNSRRSSTKPEMIMTNFYKSETPDRRHKKQTTSPTGDV